MTYTILCQISMFFSSCVSVNIVQNWAKFLREHIKSHTKHHVLETIGGKDLGPKQLGLVLLVIEGQTREGYLFYSVFDPLTDEFNVQCT